MYYCLATAQSIPIFSLWGQYYTQKNHLRLILCSLHTLALWHKEGGADYASINRRCIFNKRMYLFKHFWTQRLILDGNSSLSLHLNCKESDLQLDFLLYSIHIILVAQSNKHKLAFFPMQKSLLMSCMYHVMITSDFKSTWCVLFHKEVTIKKLVVAVLSCYSKLWNRP